MLFFLKKKKKKMTPVLVWFLQHKIFSHRFHESFEDKNAYQMSKCYLKMFLDPQGFQHQNNKLSQDKNDYWNEVSDFDWVTFFCRESTPKMLDKLIFLVLFH